MLRLASSPRKTGMIDESDGLIYYVYVNSPSESPNQVSLLPEESTFQTQVLISFIQLIFPGYILWAENARSQRYGSGQNKQGSGPPGVYAIVILRDHIITHKKNYTERA